MDGAIIMIVGVLVVSVLMWVLLPTFNSFITSAALATLNVSGTVTDYSWAGKLFIIMYVLAAALLPIGLLTYVVYKFAKGRR